MEGQQPSEQERPTKPDPGAAARGEQGVPPAPADPHERIDGLRAWLAQVDRKLGVRTYAFAAACVLALAAAAVALVFVLQLQEDAAEKSDLENLRNEIGVVEQSAEEAATDEVQALSDRIDSLEQQVEALRSDQTTTDEEIQVVQDDIDELRSDVSDLQTETDSGSGGTSP